MEANYKQRNDLLAVQILIYPHMLVKTANETRTEAETTKTEDHKVHLGDAFDLKGALASNKKSLNPKIEPALVTRREIFIL